MSRKLMLSFLVLLAAGQAYAQQTQPAKPEKGAVPPGVEYVTDLTYCKLPEGELKLDLAMPKNGSGPFPTVVCVHGGGWHMGSRKMYNDLIMTLAKNGYVAATITYRFTPKNQYPCQINDAKCVVRWLRANADKYNIDKDRIGCLGDSAGGHIVCLMGTTSSKDGLDGNGGNADQSSQVKCVVAYYPPTDLTVVHETIRAGKAPPAEGMYAKKVVEDLLGGSPEKVGMEKYQKYSSVHYASKNCAMLLIHGTADKLVPIDQSYRLEKKLKDAGVDVTVLPVENGGHSFNEKDREKSQAAALEFLAKHLKSSKSK